MSLDIEHVFVNIQLFALLRDDRTVTPIKIKKHEDGEKTKKKHKKDKKERDEQVRDYYHMIRAGNRETALILSITRRERTSYKSINDERTNATSESRASRGESVPTNGDGRALPWESQL